MTSLWIPPMDSGLADALRDIIESKHFNDSLKGKWKTQILPKIVDRLEAIADAANRHGEKFSTRPEGVNLPQSITESKTKILKNLGASFQHAPPFTIQRIAEVMLDPKKQGYSLANNSQIFKYFNALRKQFNVSSTSQDFPAPTFDLRDDEEAKKDQVRGPSGKQVPENLSLVRIPWLTDIEETKSTEKKSIETESTQTKSTETESTGEEMESNQATKSAADDSESKDSESHQQKTSNLESDKVPESDGVLETEPSERLLEPIILERTPEDQTSNHPPSTQLQESNGHTSTAPGVSSRRKHDQIDSTDSRDGTTSDEEMKSTKSNSSTKKARLDNTTPPAVDSFHHSQKS